MVDDPSIVFNFPDPDYLGGNCIQVPYTGGALWDNCTVGTSAACCSGLLHCCMLPAAFCCQPNREMSRTYV
jgi:hypothetical protein